MTISNLKVTPAGVATWKNSRASGVEVVVLWDGPDGRGWAGINKAATTYTVPTKTPGMVSVRVLQDSSDQNATFTVPAPVPPPPPAVKVQAGIAVGGNLQNEDAVTLAKDLDAIQASGAGWARIDINWAQIQAGGASSFDWTSDAAIQGAMARGMNVLGTIVYAPAWAGNAPLLNTFVTFVKQAVTHYAALGVHHFEIWNEPNLGQNWWGKANPAEYATTLEAAYTAAKTADPSCTIVTAGLAPAPSDGTNMEPTDFLAGVYAAGGAHFLDAVGAHPYCSPAMPGDVQAWSAWFKMYGAPTSLRSIMVANGDQGKQLWATEYGAPTNGPAGNAGVVSEAVQASMITQAFDVWKMYPFAGPLFVYQGRDQGTDASTDQDWYGLLRNDFSAKPALAAFKAAVS